MIGEYCRKYRIDKGLTLKDINGNDHIKTLSAFEMGRSSNMIHLIKYIKLSVELNDVNNFIKNIPGV